MQPSIIDLKAAYEESALPRLNISFQEAIDSVMFNTCLCRLAQCRQKSTDAQQDASVTYAMPATINVKEMWYDKY